MHKASAASAAFRHAAYASYAPCTISPFVGLGSLYLPSVSRAIAIWRPMYSQSLPSLSTSLGQPLFGRVARLRRFGFGRLCRHHFACLVGRACLCTRALGWRLRLAYACWQCFAEQGFERPFTFVVAQPCAHSLSHVVARFLSPCSTHAKAYSTPFTFAVTRLRGL